MARLPDLVDFAARHDLKIGSIADLIRYRLEREPTVRRQTERIVHSEYGELRVLQYHDVIDNATHLAFVAGEIDSHRPTLVRVHVHSGVFDSLTYLRESFSWPISRVLRTLSRQGGVLIVVHHNYGAPELDDALRQYGVIAPGGGEQPDDLRMLGIGGQILADLGVGMMNVLGSQKRMHGLSGFGLKVNDYISAPEDL